MSDREFDVVVVGGGVAGALAAKRLSEAGLDVLVLEAGPSSPQYQTGYDKHLRTFYTAYAKGAESAFPASPYAPQADTADVRHNDGYFIQRGPDSYGSSYTRSLGGSTLHWLGVSLRMIPEDFVMKSHFGVGRDWPIGYGDLEPYYRKAEFEMGVSADVADQAYHGLTFPEGYDFPMERVPQSYADQKLGAAVDGRMASIGDYSAPLKIRSYPAARNSMPRGAYMPVGAVDVHDNGQQVDPLMGGRCQGNTSCTPICPVQARYHAGKSLARAKREHVEVRACAVASKINTDPASGKVLSITYQHYDESGVTAHEARGRAYMLAAHAIENARLVLNSGLGAEKDVIGRNLMDHPALYAFGLFPEKVYPYRGPLSTSGMEDFRSGPFRSELAAFRYDIGNDGWRAPLGHPDAIVMREVMEGRLFGKALRESLVDTLSRQVRFSLAIEQLPSPENRITLERGKVDALGIPRPAIHYRISEYTLRGMAAASEVSRQIFAHAGIEDCSGQDKTKWFPSVSYGDAVFQYHGMGHFAGTHLMGSEPENSVLDLNQRCWEHDNLYMVGSGSFPTMGTSNPTLTIGAMAIRAAEHLIDELGANA
jgi:choline dehydrogenase-like flavoprotein